MTTPATASLAWLTIYKFAVPILLAATAYFLSGVVVQVNEQGKQIRELELQFAETRGNRFTAVDWNKHKAEMDTRTNAMDQRITRVEESVIAMKDLLIRIDKKLDNPQR